MKTSHYIVIILCFVSSFTFAQNIERVEVNGRIIVNRNDVEGVTVYNASSNKGTITDKEGNFRINVTLNDRIEISALQFKDFEISINSEIIDSKSMTVFLIEEVNKLPEIIILPYGLSGDLSTDVDNTKATNPDLNALYFGLDNLDKIDFTDDYLSGIRNTAMTDNRLYYSADVVKIVGLLFKPIFNSKKKKRNTLKTIATNEDIINKYPTEYLMQRLNIPKQQIMEFIYFVEDSGLENELLENGRELEFLDYLIKKSKQFQSIKNGKN